MIPTDQSVGNVRKEYPSVNPSKTINYRRIYIHRNLSVGNKQFSCSVGHYYWPKQWLKF